jgi:uncharacterized membrane protein YhaH (DUF805 family)
MESLAPFFSLTGKLAPRPFALAVVIVYVLSFLSQVLISPAATVRWGVWAFVLVQIPLTWTWFTLHAKRLRDAGLPAGSVFAVVVLYGLALVLLLLLIGPMIDMGAVVTEQPSTRFADMWVVLSLAEAFAGQASGGFFDALALIMLALILIPFAIAVGFSIWVGTRRGLNQSSSTYN